MNAYISWRRSFTTPQSRESERVERGRRAESLHQERMASALEARKRRSGG